MCIKQLSISGNTVKLYVTLSFTINIHNKSIVCIVSTPISIELTCAWLYLFIEEWKRESLKTKF